MAGPFMNAQGQPYVRTVDLRSILVGHGPESVNGLTPEFQARLAALVAAAPPSIQPKLGIYSGYRSPERQRQLFNASDRSGKMVARPGKSFHEKGRAVDLAYAGKSLSKAPKEVVKWIHDNAPKYGLYFPMSYENWHIEPIGTRPASVREKEAITDLQKYLVSRGAEIPVDGQWGPKTEAAFAQYAEAPPQTLLEKTGLAGREVPPPGASVLTPQQIAANYAAYRPAPNTAAPPGIGSDSDRNIGLSPSRIADNYAQYRPSLTTQPLTAPITPVQSTPLGPTPGAMAAQYAQYRPAPNLAPPSVGGIGSDPDRNLSRTPSSQALASMSSQEIASRVAAAQTQNSGSLTPAMVARYASGMTQTPTQGGIGSDPDRNASIGLSSRQVAENQNAYRPSLTTQPPSAPVTPVSRAPLAPTPGTMAEQYAQYRPAPNIAPQQPAPAAPPTQYQTVKVVTYPTAAPSKPLGQGGIGSDPDRNMATPMTMAEQYAAYRPTPNTLPPEAKKPEPVITYKKVPIPTVNDARKNGAVAAPLVPQQQALPGVPAPLMANGDDRTPKYFQPRYGLGWAGGFIGGLAGGPLGKMVGKEVGKYVASKLTRTELPTPENFAGYGLGAIQNVQNGMAGQSAYAQARNNAAGYTTQWSNTGPGGAPVQTTSTPGGTTYSTWQQYGPSPMTLVTYGAGNGTPKSSSSTTGGYTTSTGNLY